METSALEKAGLTKGEAKVYLALIDIGASTAGPISKKAGVSRSKVYEMLDGLIEKGLCSVITKNRHQHFDAADPENILVYLQKQKKSIQSKEIEFTKAIPELRLRKKNSQSSQSVTMYSGNKGIKTIFNSILAELNQGDEYYAISVEPEIYDTKNFLPFILQHHRKRAKKKIKVKLLVQKELKTSVDTTIGHTSLATIRSLAEIVPSATLIYADKVATFVWSNEPTGVVIQSQTISNRYKAFFKELWDRS